VSAVRDGDGHDKRADVPAVADVAGLALVGLLQLADSSFPSGSFTLSGGLEQGQHADLPASGHRRSRDGRRGLVGHGHPLVQGQLATRSGAA